jgi:hypothetical protein
MCLARVEPLPESKKHIFADVARPQTSHFAMGVM